MPLPQDILLENRYRLYSIIQETILETTYHGFDTKFQHPITLKAYAKAHLDEQFEATILQLAHLRQANLPRLIDYFAFEDQYCLVLDFITGDTLAQSLEQAQVPISEAKALDYLRQIGEAITYLHQQDPPLIHGNLSPQTITIGSNHQVMVMDFGFIPLHQSQDYQDKRLGLSGFIPPEQYSNFPNQPTADIYALGAILYNMLSGQIPPDSIQGLVNQEALIPPRDLNDQLTETVELAILHALELKPTDRPQTVRQWTEDLLNSRAGISTVNQAQSTRSPSPVESATPLLSPEIQPSQPVESNDQVTPNVESPLYLANDNISSTASAISSAEDKNNDPNLMDSEQSPIQKQETNLLLNQNPSPEQAVATNRSHTSEEDISDVSNPSFFPNEISTTDNQSSTDQSLIMDELDTPTMPSKMRKLWLMKPDRQGHLLRLGSLTIGRSKICDIQLEDSRVSRQHATLEFDGQVCVVYDEGSVNGTYINSVKIGNKGSRFDLGDRLRIGEIIFSLSATEPDPPVEPQPPIEPQSPYAQHSYAKPIPSPHPKSPYQKSSSRSGDQAQAKVPSGYESLHTEAKPQPQYAPYSHQKSGVQPSSLPNQYPNLEPEPRPKAKKRRTPNKRSRGGLVANIGRFIRISWFVLRYTVLLAFVGAIVLFGALIYAYLTSELPTLSDLKEKQFQFQTTTIYDRNGVELWELNDPNYGRRTYVTLDQIAPDLLNATIATEDRFFYASHNVGIDPIAILRAIYYNVTEGSVISGGSTITQQVVKNVLLIQEERQSRRLARKIKEAILAIKLANQYTKEEILEVYVNQIYYGNRAYGIEAAAQTYFGKPALSAKALPIEPGRVSLARTARELTLAEAALLAGLPQSPAYHDPYNYPKRAKARQQIVLGLMVEANYITQEEAEAAYQAPVLDLLEKPALEFEAPHFVNFVLAELENNPPQDYGNIYEAGFKLQTTLDSRLQAIAEEEVAKQVNALVRNNVTNGALVAIQATTGQILALVGSTDFWNESISGQINMAVTPRQPGSTIKPFVYLTAFEKGWTPATVIEDVPTKYPDGQGGFYEPLNYDREFHGPVSLRVSLANSYNVPAVKALDYVGLETFLTLVRRLGITTLTRDDYGLALSLGGGEVPLVEMTGAYQILANGGVKITPYAIGRVLDSLDNEIPLLRSAPEAILSPQHAYLITHILSDNDARSIEFGRNSLLNLSRPAAAKTGTTNDFRDNLVLGYTLNLVVGVWVGNADYSPMQGTTGLSGAGPIWRNFIERAYDEVLNWPTHDFIRPDGIVERKICVETGLPIQAEDTCPETRIELFAVDEDDSEATSTAILFPTSTPAPTTDPATLQCGVSPGSTFIYLWNQYRQLAGCATDQLVIIPTIAEEKFQGGVTFWRSDTGEVYIVYDRSKERGIELFEGSWQTNEGKVWDGSDPEGVGMSPPSGLIEPKRGFGWLWRNYLGGPDGPLGWALEREQGHDNIGQYQLFEQGLMFKGSENKVYLFLADGRFFAAN